MPLILISAGPLGGCGEIFEIDNQPLKYFFARAEYHSLILIDDEEISKLTSRAYGNSSANLQPCPNL